MIYIIPAATAAMLGYMLWLLVFRLRRDRVMTERNHTRGKSAFRPKDRMRFLLERSFGIAQEKLGWEDSLLSSLADVPATQARRDDASH